MTDNNNKISSTKASDSIAHDIKDAFSNFETLIMNDIFKKLIPLMDKIETRLQVIETNAPKNLLKYDEALRQHLQDFKQVKDDITTRLKSSENNMFLFAKELGNVCKNSFLKEG